MEIAHKCTACGIEKPPSEFYKNGSRLRAQCKVCSNARVKKWADMNPTRRAEHRAKWLRQNPERMQSIRIEWSRKNPHKIAEICRRRQAGRRQAVAKWADKKAMASFYAEASRKTRETGVPHEVDHIIPLTHRLVCGLHCEANLQVLPRFANRSKSNRIEV